MGEAQLAWGLSAVLARSCRSRRPNAADPPTRSALRRSRRRDLAPACPAGRRPRARTPPATARTRCASPARTAPRAARRRRRPVEAQLAGDHRLHRQLARTFELAFQRRGAQRQLREQLVGVVNFQRIAGGRGALPVVLALHAALGQEAHAATRIRDGDGPVRSSTSRFAFSEAGHSVTSGLDWLAATRHRACSAGARGSRLPPRARTTRCRPGAATTAPPQPATPSLTIDAASLPIVANRRRGPS